MSLGLQQKLNVIEKVFNIEEVLSLPVNKEYITGYYRINKIPYSIFHTMSDFIHMGISRNGVYKESDLLEAVRTVDSFIARQNIKNILELATGRGANSFWLAQRNLDVNFYGIDISEGQLAYAREKARKVKNYFPEKGDYHDLKQYTADTFDLVFEVESLCYSTGKKQVLVEVSRVLKQNGIFILFDGYRNEMSLNTAERIACSLVEKGMALEKLEHYENFKKTVLDTGFIIESEENVSKYVLPTMSRFERLASSFFSMPKTAKLISWILPKEFLYNIISGYLMPDLINQKIAVHMITILRKN